MNKTVKKVLIASAIGVGVLIAVKALKGKNYAALLTSQQWTDQNGVAATSSEIANIQMDNKGNLKSGIYAGKFIDDNTIVWYRPDGTEYIKWFAS